MYTGREAYELFRECMPMERQAESDKWEQLEEHDRDLWRAFAEVMNAKRAGFKTR